MPDTRSSGGLTGHDAGVDSLFEFLHARICESVGIAAARGDEPVERFSRQTLSILDDMRRDLDEDPRRADEVARFLYRMAAAYVDHPDYRSYWTLFSGP
ncbi:hypothetical protein [Nocardioides sp. W7]|uniref:hypothetical protein n=1 Tax=Nocardioides sp. W7 TaxID=2931390 RepID=UPI001FD5E369|nr:hypothetical protein [Nocardioides sp. W7]